MSEAVRLVVRGRVQGVGYRAWANDAALARGLRGWVRNRRDGSVEALLIGDREQIADMIEACRRGPTLARVDAIERNAAEDDESTQFRQLPTI